MQIRTVNKLIASAGIAVALEYGSSGRINFVKDGGRTYSGITWLNRLTADQWVAKAREFDSRPRYTIAATAEDAAKARAATAPRPEVLSYSSRSAMLRGLKRKNIDLNSVKEVRKLENGKLEVELA